LSNQASDYKGMTILAAFLAPVLGGAIIYYSLKKSHEALAKLGNNWSFLAIVIWIAVLIVLYLAGIVVPRSIPALFGVIGIVLAIVTVGKVKKTSS
jgi:uncharacterized Tic20 family protein